MNWCNLCRPIYRTTHPRYWPGQLTPGTGGALRHNSLSLDTLWLMRMVVCSSGCFILTLTTVQPLVGGEDEDNEFDDEFDSESSLPLAIETACPSSRETSPQHRSEIQELRAEVRLIHESQQVIQVTQAQIQVDPWLCLEPSLYVGSSNSTNFGTSSDTPSTVRFYTFGQRRALISFSVFVFTIYGKDWPTQFVLIFRLLVDFIYVFFYFIFVKL